MAMPQVAPTAAEMIPTAMVSSIVPPLTCVRLGDDPRPVKHLTQCDREASVTPERSTRPSLWQRRGWSAPPVRPAPPN